MQVGLNPLTITPTGGKAATVTFTDFIACDAIEHVLDTVLVPQSVRLFFPFAKFSHMHTLLGSCCLKLAGSVQHQSQYQNLS